MFLKHNNLSKTVALISERQVVPMGNSSKSNRKEQIVVSLRDDTTDAGIRQFPTLPYWLSNCHRKNEQ